MRKVQNILKLHPLQLFLVAASLGLCVSIYSNAGLSKFPFFRAITGTISVDRAVACPGENATITFTANGGVAPYTFNYTENGTSRSVVSNGAGVATVVNNGATSGDFEYILQTVVDNAGTTENISGQQANLKVNETLNVDFTFTNDGGCSGEPIDFEATVTGSTNYTLGWDFGDGSIAEDVLTPTHVFDNALGCDTRVYTVRLLVKDENNCSFEVQKTVTVKEKPDISFRDLDRNSFNNCGTSGSGGNYTINVGNTSASDSCVDSYFVDWGDGNTTANATFPLAHNYLSAGNYRLRIRAVGDNGCENEVEYAIENSSNPAGGFESPGNTANLCTPTGAITFNITNWGLNTPETRYTVNFGDNNEVVYTQADLEASPQYNAGDPASSAGFPVPHVYTEGSCDLINQQYIARLTVSNSCGSTSFSISNIRVLDPSVLDFNSPAGACVNQPVTFENLSEYGEESNCTVNSDVTWDFGDGTVRTLFSETEENDISHTYTTPGNYTVKLTVQTRCSTEEITKQICVQPETTSSFTLDQTEGCGPVAIAATNTVDNSQLCPGDNATYQWTVTYAPDNCGTVANWNFTNGTNSTSENPEFLFTNPGIYTIQQAVTTDCGTATSTQQVNVKKRAEAVIANIDDLCDIGSITPTATVERCSFDTDAVTYNWTFPGGTPSSSNQENPGTISYSTPGTYEVRLQVTTLCGTSDVAVETFTVFEKPVVTNTVLTQEVCAFLPTTPINLTSSLPNSSFSWTATGAAGISNFQSSGTGATIPSQTISNTNSTAGTVTYTVTPSKDGCDGDPVDFVITVNPAPFVSTQPVGSEVCQNGTPTTLEVAYSQGTGTPSYQWFSNTTNSNSGGTAITGATSATYNPPSNVVGTTYYYAEISFSTGGCSLITSNTAEVIITQQPTITSTATNQTICEGGTANSLEVTYTGGVGNASYQWYSNTVNNNTTGTPIVGATSTSYTPPTFNTAGAYYYYVTINYDGNGCNQTTSDVYQINVNNDPIIDTQPIASQELCANSTPTDLTVTASGGSGSAFNYQWFRNTNNSNAGGTPIGGAVSNSYTPPTNAIGTQYYYVVVSQVESGCSVVSNVSSVIIDEEPVFTTQPTSSVVCVNGSPTPLEVAYSNGPTAATYQWYSNTTNSNSGGTLIAGATSSTYNPPTNSVGTIYYYAEISFAGAACSLIRSNTATIEVTEQVNITSTATTETICEGGNVGPFEVTFTGGAGNPTYQWYFNTVNNNTTGIAIGGANGLTYTPNTFTTAGDFYYYLVISFDGNGCNQVSSDLYQVTVVEDPAIDTQPLATQEVCLNTTPTNLEVVVSGGTASGYTYQWYSNNTNNNTGGGIIAGATNPSYTPATNFVGTRYYYVEITQPESGCRSVSNVSTVSVTELPTLTTQPTSSEVCQNAAPTTLSVAYTGGTGTPSYQWFSNTSNSTVGGTPIPGATSANYDPLSNTVGTTYYYATISFSPGGCSTLTSDIASVIVYEIPTIANDAIQLNSGAEFNYDPSAIGTNIVPTRTTYTWATPTINPPGLINGATAGVNQSSIRQTLQNTSTQEVLVTYEITPTNGTCSGTPFTLEVTVSSALNVTAAITNISCFNANDGSIDTSISGGVPFGTGAPYLTSWTGPNGFTSSDADLTNLAPGSYTVNIEDSAGATLSETYVVTQPNELQIQTDTERNISCNQGSDGNISVTILGGTAPFTLNWSTANGSGIVPNSTQQTALTVGTYTLDVTDANGCTTSETYVLTEPDALGIQLQSQTNVLCFGATTGSIDINVTGGTPTETSPGVFEYTYQWSGPNGFSSSNEDLSNIQAGSYTVTVTDNLGCTIPLTVEITQPDDIDIQVNKNDISCYGRTDGNIDISVSGGVGPYSISWDNLANGFSLTDLSAGTYTATITDANNCVKVEAITISEPDFTMTTRVTPITCNGETDGSITLNVTGGVAPINVEWADDSTAGLTRNGLGPGTYSVRITDSSPSACPIEETFVIIDPPGMTVTSTITDAVDCAVADRGAIDLTVVGGTPPYSFVWSNTETTEDISNLPAGDYSVTVTDSQGCNTTSQFTIFRQEDITITLDRQMVPDCPNFSVSEQITATTSGGFPPYTYSWSAGTVNANNPAIMNAGQNGSYVLTVTDNNGCSATSSFTVSLPETGTPDFSYSSAALTSYNFLSIDDPIQFTNLTDGDYSSVRWDFGDGSVNSSEENPIHTYETVGRYTVRLTVTFDSGCLETVERDIEITIGYKLILPNGFTPNGDGFNEVIRPSFAGFTAMSMTIYDNWGTTLYFEEGSTSLTGWDGKINGQPAMPGNYVMVVKGTTFNNQEISKTTPVTLIR
tara:strand:+ start:126988 stop:133959 length:6972 start_codon:yes stop_codon:yes gene_type:complete